MAITDNQPPSGPTADYQAMTARFRGEVTTAIKQSSTPNCTRRAAKRGCNDPLCKDKQCEGAKAKQAAIKAKAYQVSQRDSGSSASGLPSTTQCQHCNTEIKYDDTQSGLSAMISRICKPCAIKMRVPLVQQHAKCPECEEWMEPTLSQQNNPGLDQRCKHCTRGLGLDDNMTSA